MSAPKVETFVKRPIQIKAVRFDGSEECLRSLWKWIQKGFVRRADGENDRYELWVEANHSWLPVEPGEWVALEPILSPRDAKPMFYPIKAEAMDAGYERVVGYGG